MADQVRVFVSHHHSPDEDSFTMRLVKDLKDAHFDVWVDDQSITSEDFVRKINEGLVGRQWLVLVMTPASVASPWVQREVNAALNEATAERMQGVIPIVMLPTPEQDIPILWRPLYRYDATHAYEPARDKLLYALGQITSTVPPTDRRSDNDFGGDGESTDTSDLQRRVLFDRKMYIVMRRCTELVWYETRAERPSGLTLPEHIVRYLEEIIRDDIFGGLQVRIRLFLKNVKLRRSLPLLTPRYMGTVEEGPAALLYPASFAAWSLVLGRTLVFPNILVEHTTAADNDWLRRANKLPELIAALDVLMQEAVRTGGFQEIELLSRFKKLRQILESIRTGSNTDMDSIAGTDLVQAGLASEDPSYPWSICVPYPMRLRADATPLLPEIAVLNVGVRKAEPLERQRQGSDSFGPFTPGRVLMLESVMEVIGMVLVTADVLGMPHGGWASDHS